MNQKFRGLCFGLLTLATISLVGCGGDEKKPSKSDDGKNAKEKETHNHDDEKPESFAAGMKKLDELCAGIKSAFAEKDVEKAHGPVHEVGHLLEALPELANKVLPKEDQDTVKAAVESLMDSYGAVDERLHDEDAGKPYDDVSKEIDDALAKLKAIKLPEDKS